MSSLLEREAVSCESGRRSGNGAVLKIYRVHPDILNSWSDGLDSQINALRPELLNDPKSPESQIAVDGCDLGLQLIE